MDGHDAQTTWMVGRFRLDTVSEFEGPRMPPQAMFPALTPLQMEEALAQVPAGSYESSTGQLMTSVHSWLIRSDDGLVMLVDTCFGNNKNRPKFPPFHMKQTDWLRKLAALGVTPSQVTHVVNTHLHHDHVGWNTYLDDGRWRPTFPQARYLMPRSEAEAGGARTPDWNVGAFEDSVAPVIEAGLATFITPPHAIAPGLRIVAAPGHSPGMTIVEVADGKGAGMLVGGDPMHHVLQVFVPEANTGFCEDKQLAAATRHSLLARSADEGWTIGATHFFVPRALNVRRAGSGFALA